MSAMRESDARSSEGGIPGDVQRALDDVKVPSYVIDRFGIIRWLNPAALELVGDVRGRQQSSVVAPEQVREARESFTRKMLGTERTTEASAFRSTSARSPSTTGGGSSASSASSRRAKTRPRRAPIRT
jgi:PAS domain-containing protein